MIYYYDLTDPEITETQKPNVTIAEGSLSTAYACGMCQTAATFNGYVRVKCVEKPMGEITLTCTLSEKGGSWGGAGSTVPGELSPEAFACDMDVDRAIKDAFGGTPASE